MNEYKKGLTPEEAALLALGLDMYVSLSEALTVNSAGSRYDSCINEEERLNFLKNIQKAGKIREALISEVQVRLKYGEHTKETLIEIFPHWYPDETLPSPDEPRKLEAELTRITKKSLAKWFHSHNDLEIAKKFDPYIESDTTQPLTSNYDHIKAPELVLAIDAYYHFWHNLKETDKIPTNDDVQNWLDEETKKRPITHLKNGSEETKGLSQKTKESMAIIIKPAK